CGIRHPSPSARRTYASGLAGERHDAVQPAGVARDPEEAPGEHAAIEKGSKLLLDEARHLRFVILLGRQKRFQLAGHDCIESRLFGITRPVGAIGDHEGVAGCNPRRNCCCRKISNIGKRVRTEVWSLRDYLVALVAALPTTVPATIRCFPNPISVPGFAGGS